MKFRRNFLSRLYRSPEPGDDGGSPAATDTTASTAQDTTATAAPAEGAAGAPNTMLEAMFGQKTEPATAAEQVEAAAAGVSVQQLRDGKTGRWVSGKTPEQAAAATDPAKKPPNPNDPTVMPEGLTPKAQERFQTLANTNKELSAKVAEMQPAFESALQLQSTFRENGVRREQFDQAMQAVGMINRGDLEGALKVLDEQRRLISLTLGKSLPGADALSEFPDLRDAVDNLQITEQHAMEIARGRTVQNHQQRATQQQQHQQDTQQQQEQAKNKSLSAIDKFCKARMAEDMDYAAIEPMLLAQIEAGLLEGVPYERRAAIVEKTYGLIKQTASATRASAPSTSVLRPTGGESPRQAPKTMHEAMWGSR